MDKTWFNPDAQILILNGCSVTKYNWDRKVDIPLFKNGRPDLPQQEITKLTLQVDAPWKIVSFGKSGDNVITELINNGHTLNVSSSDGMGLIQCIELGLSHNAFRKRHQKQILVRKKTRIN